MKLSELVLDLDAYLSVSDIEDYPKSFNGLQIENSGKVDKVSVAVDACESVFQAAIAAKTDLLIVHHGLFWNGAAPVTGAYYRKLKLAIENNLAVYSSHLPLDLHALVGNNAILANLLELPKERMPFLGVGLRVEAERERAELIARVERVVGGSVHLAPGGPEVCRRIGVATGGAGSEIFKAAQEGVDTLITGEGPHWSYTAAEELGLNLIYAGHYATETFGVKALAQHLEKKFGLPWQFLDHPTAL